MQNLIKLAGIFVLAAIMGVVLAGCPGNNVKNGLSNFTCKLRLAFTLINNGTAYAVSKGTASTAVVAIPAVADKNR